MILSASEAASLTKLAMRGVGYPWGIAEESALVMHWLTQHRMPGLQLITNILQWIDEHDVQRINFNESASEFSNGSGFTCPLTVGIAFNDIAYRLSKGNSLQLQNVVCPLLVFPFLDSASRALDLEIRVRWSAGEALVLSGRLISDMSTESLVADLGQIESVKTLVLSGLDLSVGSSLLTSSENLKSDEKNHVHHHEVLEGVDAKLLDSRVCADADSQRVCASHVCPCN